MACIRRITVCVHKYGHMPKYFTYRSRDEYKEDTIYRHLEPALAFQLELSRLRNFSLNLIPTQNHRMHLYHGIAKTDGGKSSIDQRFFVRAIIRHSDLVTQEASFLYLKAGFYSSFYLKISPFKLKLSLNRWSYASLKALKNENRTSLKENDF